MLISLHLPKTAGSSFRASLEEYYHGDVRRDYADLPINTPKIKRNIAALKHSAFPGGVSRVSCIHGHFLPLKYFFLKDAKFITWMRDPVERLASHYYYWQRHYDPKNCPPLHRQMMEEAWSLEDFCLNHKLRNFYSQFLWGFPIRKFDFIGITEHYESDIEYFSRQFMGAALPVYAINTNETKKTSAYFADMPQLRQDVERYHRKDIALYNKALDMRANRPGVVHE